MKRIIDGEDERSPAGGGNSQRHFRGRWRARLVGLDLALIEVLVIG